MEMAGRLPCTCSSVGMSLEPTTNSQAITEGTQEEIQECIINVDESGVDRPDPKRIRVMAPPKSDAALAIDRAKVDHITLVGCVDAAGGRMPAFLINKGTDTSLLWHRSSQPSINLTTELYQCHTTT